MDLYTAIGAVTLLTILLVAAKVSIRQRRKQKELTVAREAAERLRQQSVRLISQLSEPEVKSSLELHAGLLSVAGAKHSQVAAENSRQFEVSLLDANSALKEAHRAYQELGRNRPTARNYRLVAEKYELALTRARKASTAEVAVTQTFRELQEKVPSIPDLISDVRWELSELNLKLQEIGHKEHPYLGTFKAQFDLLSEEADRARSYRHEPVTVGLIQDLKSRVVQLRKDTDWFHRYTLLEERLSQAFKSAATPRVEASAALERMQEAFTPQCWEDPTKKLADALNLLSWAEKDVETGSRKAREANHGRVQWTEVYYTHHDAALQADKAFELLNEMVEHERELIELKSSTPSALESAQQRFMDAVTRNSGLLRNDLDSVALSQVQHSLETAAELLREGNYMPANRWVMSAEEQLDHLFEVWKLSERRAQLGL